MVCVFSIYANGKGGCGGGGLRLILFQLISFTLNMARFMCQPLTVGAALEIETPGQWVMMLPLDRDEKLCWIGRLWLATGIKNLQPAITLFSGGRAPSNDEVSRFCLKEARRPC